MAGLISILKRLTGKQAAGTQSPFDAAIRPDAPFFAVGDIHGRLDLLNEVLNTLRAQGADRSHPIVFVGDYIDRGPSSAGVLHRLFDLQMNHQDRVVCLQGNHEDLMLGFLDDPSRYARVWLQNGGTQTLESFGVSLDAATAQEDDLLRARDALQTALGSDMTAWLRALPVTWRSGNVWVTHAGADPMVDLDRQDRTALLWGHPDFRKIARRDGQWVVHGHTIVPEVTIRDGRASIDTGAYKTGQLSVVQVGSEKIEVFKPA